MFCGNARKERQYLLQIHNSDGTNRDHETGMTTSWKSQQNHRYLSSLICLIQHIIQQYFAIIQNSSPSFRTVRHHSEHFIITQNSSPSFNIFTFVILNQVN